MPSAVVWTVLGAEATPSLRRFRMAPVTELSAMAQGRLPPRVGLGI
jgi:hypothetical protein